MKNVWQCSDGKVFANKGAAITYLKAKIAEGEELLDMWRDVVVSDVPERDVNEGPLTVTDLIFPASLSVMVITEVRPVRVEYEIKQVPVRG